MLCLGEIGVGKSGLCNVAGEVTDETMLIAASCWLFWQGREPANRLMESGKPSKSDSIFLL